LSRFGLNLSDRFVAEDPFEDHCSRGSHQGCKWNPLEEILEPFGLKILDSFGPKKDLTRRNSGDILNVQEMIQ